MSHTRPALPELMCDGKGCTKKSRSRAGHSVTKINGYIVCSDACERTLPSVPAGHIRRITSFQTNNGFWHHVEYAMPDAAEVRSANKTKDMLDAYSRTKAKVGVNEKSRPTSHPCDLGQVSRKAILK